MKAVIVDTYYPAFLARFYGENPIAAMDYGPQRRKLLDACFGTSDFYSRHLAGFDVDADELIGNSVPLQLQWAREHGILAARLLPRRLPALVQRVLTASGVLVKILAEQVRALKPEVLFLQDLQLIPPPALRSLKKHVKLLVGQCGIAPPAAEVLRLFDLMLTSLPHFVPRFRALGIAAEYFRLGFDPSVLERVGVEKRQYPCTFVGGFSSVHRTGSGFLQHMAEKSDIAFFGYGAETLPPDSPIRRRHRGEVWALDMYRVLAQSQITLNRHAEYAENNANNMRLFEATGMGAMLLTDAKANLGELYEVGTEVVAYRSPEEAVELIRHYSDHPDEREAIARAGQRRTLRDHSYQRRMEELSQILKRHLKR